MDAQAKVYSFVKNELETGKQIDFHEYEGKLLLIVNTASSCGFTPQLKGLEALYEKYKEQGLMILGFPCNQFGHQDPGTGAEIREFCTSHYSVTFPLFEKVEVNGPGADPLFQYLTAELPGTLGRKVKWNFTKFLISKDGTPLRRFASATTPEKLSKIIEEHL